MSGGDAWARFSEQAARAIILGRRDLVCGARVPVLCRAGQARARSGWEWCGNVAHMIFGLIGNPSWCHHGALKTPVTKFLKK